MILNKITLALLLVLLAGSAPAFELSAGTGFDSNPYELSGNPDAASYTDLDISHAGSKDIFDRSELRYDASFLGRIYESEFNDADTYRLRLRSRYVDRLRIGSRSANLLVTADWISDRRTYFSQKIKAIPTSRGVSLADRFDYNSPKISSEFIYRFNRAHSLGLYGYFTHRNYVEDYEEIDLENLDFYEFSVQPTYRYKSENGLIAKAFVYYRKRVYEDLLEDDLLGKNIIGDKLRYNFYGYGLNAKKSFGERLSVNAYVDGYFAEDEALGFRDFQFHRLRLGFDFNVTKTHTLSGVGSCYIRDFKLDAASPKESETGYAGRLRKACKAEAVYRAPISFFKDKNVYWNASIGTEIESNSDSNLSYDKVFASFSVSYSF